MVSEAVPNIIITSSITITNDSLNSGIRRKSYHNALDSPRMSLMDRKESYRQRGCAVAWIIMSSSLINVLSTRQCTRKFSSTFVASFTTTRSSTTARRGLPSLSTIESVLNNEQRNRFIGPTFYPSTNTGSRCWMSSTAAPSVLDPNALDDDDSKDDLDAALENILGNVVRKPNKESNGYANGSSKQIYNRNEDNDDDEEDDDHSEDVVIDYNDREILSTSNPRWTKLGLRQSVIDVLSEKGITHLTPVQAEAFEPVLQSRDVIGRSRTGTGKTLAFGLPSLTRLVEFTEQAGKRLPNGRMVRGRAPSMIVLCPTRELSKQVQEELSTIAKPLGLFVDVVHGGVSYGPQASSLAAGVDCLVGTPGRVIDLLERGNLKLNTCDIVVLDEADEMLNMGFADDVETILQGVGSDNGRKAQCLLFSATTPPWVKEIGRQYQSADVMAIDATSQEGGGARVATTVRHVAIQVPPGEESKKSILEDIIAVEIAKDSTAGPNETIDEGDNPIAAAAAAKKKNSTSAMQQRIFGKTIVFTETKKQADELVAGSVFKSLTAQALHGDVGQKQRDSILAAFRAGAFNVLVATDVAARGIDIQDVDLVIQFDPPRDVDTYVHRSGRTGRAGRKGVSVLLFNNRQARDIVRIERDLGHNFKFQLTGPPSIETTLKAVARASALACESIPDATSQYFEEAAAELLQTATAADEDSNVNNSPGVVSILAKCLAAISRRSTEISSASRSLITGEAGIATIQMTNRRRNVSLGPNDVMFTVGKLSRMSQKHESLAFDSEIGKIQTGPNGILFDMDVNDATKLVEFAKEIDAGGNSFEIIYELEVDRDRYFGKSSTGRGGSFDRRGGSGSRGGGGGGGYSSPYGADSRAKGGGRSYSRNENSSTGRSNRSGGGSSGYNSDGGGYSRDGRSGGGSRSTGGAGGGRYDNSRSRNNPRSYNTGSGNDGW